MNGEHMKAPAHVTEDRRLKRIETLMESDPAPDTPEGQELNALVDEQIEAERGIFP